MSDVSKWLHRQLGLPEINLNHIQATSQISGRLTKQAAIAIVGAIDLSDVRMLAEVCKSRLDHDAELDTPEAG